MGIKRIAKHLVAHRWRERLIFTPKVLAGFSSRHRSMSRTISAYWLSAGMHARPAPMILRISLSIGTRA